MPTEIQWGDRFRQWSQLEIYLAAVTASMTSVCSPLSWRLQLHCARNQKNTVPDELDELDAMCVALFGDREDSGAEFVDAALDSHFRSGGGALSESVLRDELLARIIFDVLAFDFGPGECKGTTLLNATCPRNSDS
jgi:hypothetical protein